jgi:sec-independent protein translocase protein TatB
VFGFSFSEVVLIGVVTLVAVGPQRLPGMLKNFGQWMKKLRKMTTEVRQQTGIDDMLRAEGMQGGLTELRSLMRGGGGVPAPVVHHRPPEDPYKHVDFDPSREYPPEGPDSKGALPDDLVMQAESPAQAEPTPAQTEPTPAQAEPTPAQAEPTPTPAEPSPAPAETTSRS